MTALVDTGASVSMISNKFFNCLVQKHRINPTGTRPVARTEFRKLISADASPLNVIASVDTDVKINGIIIPFSFIIIEGLAYDAIFGMSFLSATRAQIDLANNTLSLYDGLTTIAMTRRMTAADVVYTIANVSIPPHSETILPVASTTRHNGNYIIEGDPRAPCRALAVARVLVNPSHRHLQCRVLNPTDRPITLRKRTPIGTLAAVDVNKPSPVAANIKVDSHLPTIAEMRQAVESKGVKFDQTSVTGKDLDDLITMLYRNRDLMATSLRDLPGTDTLPMKIDTQNHPPKFCRQFRQSPADKAEISRQVQEMLDAGIIEEGMSPWSSAVLLVRKKNGEARLVLDYRFLNSVTSLVSFPIITFDEVIDTLADAKPTLFSTLDLKSGYWQCKLDPATADRTAFSTSDGSFIFRRLPFGVTGGVAHFQKLMTTVLRNLTPTACLVYLDDIVCFSKNNADMISKLQQIFDRFRQNNLRIHG